jgi:ribonuclease BN (tRNA processing enzyme)
VCENTHFLPIRHLDLFKKIRPGKLVFNHVSGRNEKQFPEVKKAVDYPVFIAKDGDVFEIK